MLSDETTAFRCTSALSMRFSEREGDRMTRQKSINISFFKDVSTATFPLIEYFFKFFFLVKQVLVMTVIR